MHKLKVKSLIDKKYQAKIPINLSRRQSSKSLRPKIEVEAQRLLNKKYQRNNPFSPDYLESEYL